jgi:hypothetical protein
VFDLREFYYISTNTCLFQSRILIPTVFDLREFYYTSTNTSNTVGINYLAWIRQVFVDV